MALVHTSFHANPLESSRLSQRELLERIFGQHEAEDEHVHHMDYEESSSDSGSDYEMEEYHEGTIFCVFLLTKIHIEGKLKGVLVGKSREKVLYWKVQTACMQSAARLTWAFFSSKTI